jgi:hypothetical protein
MLGYGGHLWAVRLLPFAAAVQGHRHTSLLAIAASLVLKCQSTESRQMGHLYVGTSSLLLFGSPSRES